jgi:hypothetical protein
MKIGPHECRYKREMVWSDKKEDSSSDCTGIKMLNQVWPKGRQEAWRLKEELEQGAVFFYSTFTVSTLPRKLSRGLETSERGNK